MLSSALTGIHVERIDNLKGVEPFDRYYVRFGKVELEFDSFEKLRAFGNPDETTGADLPQRLLVGAWLAQYPKDIPADKVDLKTAEQTLTLDLAAPSKLTIEASAASGAAADG